MKKHWVNPNCQNSEPTKMTVSISAKEIEICSYSFFRRLLASIKKFDKVRFVQKTKQLIMKKINSVKVLVSVWVFLH